MNIYQTVIDSVAASAGNISESAGFINITGSANLSIPKAGVVAARRVLAGERAQSWTVAIPSSPSNSTTYTVSVSGKSPVTGILKSFTANYTTAVSGITQAILSNGLAAALASYEAPYTVSGAGTATLTITAKSGTPVISVASNLLTVENATVALTSVANISTAGVITVGSGAPFASTDLGKMVTMNDGTTFYTGIVKTYTSTSELTATPAPSAAMTGGNDKLFIVENTGSVLESVYAYAALPGVTLASSTKYVIYEIDAIGSSEAGNGARPDVIEGKYIIYVNAGDSDTWSSGGFDETLATKCGLSNF